MSVDAPLRWGICSAGKISHDFTLALQILPKEDHQVTAVAARDLKKAQEFAKKFEIRNAYGCYNELAKDPDVDIVYIGSVNPCHFEHCKLMLNAGKHVLCEKPLAINKKQVTEILELAREKKLFFMEAYWTMFHPAILQLRKEVDSGTIGDLLALNASFGVELAHLPRNRRKDLGGGALLDLGCYLVAFSTLLFKEKPHKISAAGCLTDEGVDSCSTTTLIYSNNRIATLSNSMCCKYQNTAYVHGTKGTIEVPDFWHSTRLVLPTTTLDFPLPSSTGAVPWNFPGSQGLSYEAEAVRQCILKGQTECDAVPHSFSRTVVDMMDTTREQLGVTFDQDDE